MASGTPLHRFVPVPGAPVLDDIEPTAPEMVIEEVPERRTREDTNVCAVIDDDIEPAGSELARDPVKKRRVLLNTLVYSDPSGRIINGDIVHVDPGDHASLEEVSPHPQRSASVDAKLEQRDLLVAKAREQVFVTSKIVAMDGLVGLVSLGDHRELGTWHA